MAVTITCDGRDCGRDITKEDSVNLEIKFELMRGSGHDVRSRGGALFCVDCGSLALARTDALLAGLISEKENAERRPLELVR